MKAICCPEKSKEVKEILNIITKQAEDYHLLFIYTRKLKKMLLEECNEDSLEKIIKERGLLIDKLIASKKYLDTFKEFPHITDHSRWKLQIYTLVQNIRQLLDDIISLDAVNISLMKQCIIDITLSLEKIKEGRHFMSTMEKHIDNTPFYIDVCG